MDVLITLFGLAFAAFGSTSLVLAVKKTDWLSSRCTAARFRIGLGLQWFLTVVLLAFVLLVEDRSLASIGIQSTGAEMLPGVVFGFIIAGGMAIVIGLSANYFGITEPDATTVFIVAQPPHWKVITALTMGITGEIVFRGYLIERTLELTGSAVVAGTLSGVAFALTNLQGRKVRSVLPAIVGTGVGLVVAYLIFRNVIVLAFVHTLLSALSLLSSTPEDVLDEVDTSTLDERIVALVGDE